VQIKNHEKAKTEIISMQIKHRLPKQ